MSDSNRSLADNPLVEVRLPIPFDRVRAEHVGPAVEHLLELSRSKLRGCSEVSGPRTYENTMRVYDDSTRELDYAMAVVGHLEAVCTSPELREAYNAVQPIVSEFRASIALDEKLYRGLRAYAQTDEARALTGPKRRFLDKTLEEFRRNGAELDEAGKQKLRDLTVALSKATTKFSQNTLDDTNAFELVLTDEAKLKGLPAHAVQAAKDSARARGVGGYRFTLQAPSYLAVMTYLEDAALRRELWLAYNGRASSGAHDNRPLLDEILRLRRDFAALLGYRDFADLVLADRMAKEGARARAFVEQLVAQTRPHYERENEELQAFRRELEGPNAPTLEPWDLGFYAEKQRKARFDFDEELLRPYLPADRALQGMFELASRLYGVQVTQTKEVPVWHPEVQAFELRDEKQQVLGLFYVDLFPRETKRDGAWMNGIVTAMPGEGPHVGLFCANSTPPSGGRPALLTHREVETFFHEFGHLLHHLLSRSEVRTLAGTNVAWDFVELPSQIMENWCWEREALALFARHVDTNEPLPAELFDRMVRARTYRAANMMMRQLSFATVDLALHCGYDPARDGDAVTFGRKVMQPFYPVALPERFAMLCSFGHLFSSATGYAAGYYSYKWAEVLDADAFTRFKREGVFSARVGAEFRDKILARGDGEDPAVLFRDFMGRDATVEALLERSGLRAA